MMKGPSLGSIQLKGAIIKTRAIYLDILILVNTIVVLLATLLIPMSFYMVLATISLIFFNMGIILRKKRAVHIAMMGTGVIMDLTLVLTLESQRSAIDTVTTFDLTGLQMAHVGLALLAVIAYFPTIFLAVMSLRKPTLNIQIHKNLGKLSYALRFLSWVFMFSFLDL